MQLSLLGNFNIEQAVFEDAVASGERQYLSTRPCKDCGSHLRYIAGKRCVKCERARCREKSGRLRHGRLADGRTYQQVLDEQDGKCRICRTLAKMFSTRLHVDHDHKTGKIRGLLCPGCNLMLGYALDNPKILENGKKYLIEFATYTQ